MLGVQELPTSLAALFSREFDSHLVNASVETLGVQNKTMFAYREDAFEYLEFSRSSFVNFGEKIRILIENSVGTVLSNLSL